MMYDMMFQHCLSLGNTLLDIIGHALGVHTSYFGQFFNRSFYILRMLRYPSLSNEPQKILSQLHQPAHTHTHTHSTHTDTHTQTKREPPAFGIGEHTDYGSYICVYRISA